jgi:hypothetical protein
MILSHDANLGSDGIFGKDRAKWWDAPALRPTRGSVPSGLSVSSLERFFNHLTTKLFCISFGLRALPVPPMRRIERITGAITATHIRLAIVLALAAAVFLNLAIMHRAQGTQVGERVRSHPFYD